MNRLNIALFGAGGIAKAHLAAAEALKDRVAVTAVIEPRADARDAIARQMGARSFASPDEFFGAGATSIANAAMVCTPPNVRVDLSKRALEAGLAVFVEKPLAHTAADAKALAQLARTHAPRTAVGYCHRFTPAMVEMKKRADNGELGEVIRFENTFACWHPGMHSHWMSDPAVSGGGSFIDTGCHSLDLFRYLVGNGTMTAAIYHDFWKGRGESNATVLLRSTSTATHTKCVGLIQSGWVEPARFTVQLTGTKASLSYDYERPTELILVPSEGERQVISVETHESRFKHQLAAFAELATGAAPPVLPASFEDGWAVAKLVDEAAGIRQII